MGFHRRNFVYEIRPEKRDRKITPEPSPQKEGQAQERFFSKHHPTPPKKVEIRNTDTALLSVPSAYYIIKLHGAAAL
jgi:hypothetical protein